MQVRCCPAGTVWPELRDGWNALGEGCPFRRWDWSEAWWHIYGHVASGHGGGLFVLAVTDELGLAAIVPCYRNRTPRGNVVRFLGTGEVCSDYLGIPCRPGCEEAVALALADWFTLQSKLSEWADSDLTQRWDLLDWEDIDPADLVVPRLVQHLRDPRTLRSHNLRFGLLADQLTDNVGRLLALLSKSHRKQLRRSERRLADGTVRLTRASTPQELSRGLAILVQLHKSRQESRGNDGAFASSDFRAFHSHVSHRLLASGHLNLIWLEVNDRPVAVEYQIFGDQSVYAYQSGIDPMALDLEPGRLITVASVKHAIEAGYTSFDFLRGNEPYKAHWRATPRVTRHIRVVNRSGTGRMFHRLRLAGSSMRQWLKNGWQTVQGQPSLARLAQEELLSGVQPVTIRSASE